LDIYAEDHLYGLTIELSHYDRVSAAQIIDVIESITEALLGPEGERWSLQAARNDMSVALQRRGDLYRLCARLDDLGHGHLFDHDSIFDRVPDDGEVDAATS
jgi:hypothetical protein